MTKRLRLTLILALVAVALSFLFPSINWYLGTSDEDRLLATASNERIRILSQQRARDDVELIKEYAAEDEGRELPDDIAYLQAITKKRMDLAQKARPTTWTVGTIVREFRSESELVAEVETHHRETLLGLKDLRSRSLQLGLDLMGGMYVVIQPDFDSLSADGNLPLTVEEREDAMRRALEILNNRIDQFGVTEPKIRQRGDDQIIVEMPGAPDPERMRNFVLGKGRLNFHIVDAAGLDAFRSFRDQNPGGYLDANGNLSSPSVLPAGTALRGVYQEDPYGLDERRGFTVIREQIGLSGTQIRDAQVSRDPVTNRPVVNFFLSGEGGEIFYKLTGDNVGETLAVALDDKVKATARIAEPIRDAVRVTGFTEQEADDLALVLRTGALPVPLEIVSQQAIGASLGEDAIRQGVNAIGLGMVLVVVFMAAYYKVAGLIADFVLILNLFFIVSVLSVFSFTLTLPSIAGVILTVGMAVDANVIIFERIKEEYRAGKAASAAVSAGFSKAFWTVMDANITTFIAALALSQLGSGPIQGFAVTLSIGIVTSMFTALVVSRLIFDFAIEVLRISRLSIAWRLVR